MTRQEKITDMQRQLAVAVSRGDTARATHLRMAIVRLGSCLGARAERKS